VVFALLNFFILSKALLSPFWCRIVINLVTLITIPTTYGLGGALQHGALGQRQRKSKSTRWRCVQPLRGGTRFVMLQISTWFFTAAALSVPWLAAAGLGILADTHIPADDVSLQGGLLVTGATLTVMAHTSVVCALSSFETGKPRGSKVAWGMLSTSSTWWWAFVLMQLSLSVSAAGLTYLVQNHMNVNDTARVVVLTVFTWCLSVAVALTSSVGGQARHGAARYQHFQPFKGGPLFCVLQMLGRPR